MDSTLGFKNISEFYSALQDEQAALPPKNPVYPSITILLRSIQPSPRIVGLKSFSRVD